MVTHLTRWKTACLTVLALLPPLLSHICTNKDQIQPYLLKSRLYVNYIITGACWARLFCSSGMKRSPITPDSKKNMGSVAELRIKSILWSNLRRCSSNKAESNGKIKSAQCLDSPTLLIWPPEWSLISSWQKLGERVNATATGHLEFEQLIVWVCSSAFARPDRKAAQKLEKRGKRITSLLLNAVSLSFFLLVYLCQSPADMWPEHQREIPPGCCSTTDLHTTRSEREALIRHQIVFLVSCAAIFPSSTLKEKFNTAGEELSCQEADEDMNTSFITVW